MLLETGSEAYKIRPVIDAQNYQLWKVVGNILWVDGIMKIVDGSEKKPSKSPTELEEKYDKSVERYEKQFQDFQNWVAKWENKNLKANGRIKLACKEETLIEVNDIYMFSEVWEKLKKYNSSDKSIFRTAQ